MLYGTSVLCFKPLRLGAVFLCKEEAMEQIAYNGFKPLRLGAVFL